MLEYLSYKKFKKHKAEKEAEEAKKGKEVATEEQSQTTGSEAAENHKPQEHDKHHIHSHPTLEHRPSSEHPPLSTVLDKDDESWLQSILDDDSPPPALPPRVKTPVLDISSDSDGASTHQEGAMVNKEELSKEEEKDKKKDKKEKGKEEKHHNRLTGLFHRSKKHGDTLKPEEDVPPHEAERETKDLGNVLDRLNLSAKNNKVLSLSDESSELLQKFTLVFKDLVNGVPTAVGDLTSLVEDRDGTLNRGFEKLPSSLQKLVTQLPDKLTSSLAPELLAAAAESQGLKADTEGGMKDAAMKLLKPQNLTELVTKPGAIVSMLKAIVNALKVRWPAFIGTNVIWSVALFLLMFVLWYCHKRGREVRLEKAKAATETPIDGSDRIEELPDDPQLPAPESTERGQLPAPPISVSEPTIQTELPPPPVPVLEPTPTAPAQAEIHRKPVPAHSES